MIFLFIRCDDDQDYEQDRPTKKQKCADSHRSDRVSDSSTVRKTYDIGQILGTTLSAKDKFDVIQNVFKPAETYTFPKTTIGKCNRSFRRIWLDTYDGLVYSPSIDGAFCMYCALFTSDSKKSKHVQLVTEPFRNWKKATERFDEHLKNVRHNSGDLSKSSHLKPGTGHQNHQDCSIQAKELVRVMRQERPSIESDVVLDTTLQERKQQNMAVLETIVETILLCGRQNMAFRGHRDDEKHDDMSGNCGNFRALLNYRVNGGDEALKAHCERAPKNATYKSKTTQNELINIIGDIILKRIVADINQSGGWYSVSADEVRDTSNKEQLAVTLRFCDANGKSRRKHSSG